MEDCQEANRLNQHKTWRICTIFFPDPAAFKDTTTTSSTLNLLSPFAKEIFVITGNLPSDIISNNQTHFINVKHGGRPLPVLLRVFRFILLQLKMSYHLLMISGKIDLLFLAAGSATMFLPTLSAKLLQKKIILLRHGTASFQETAKKDYRGVLFGIGSYIFPLFIDYLIKLNCILADRIVVFRSELTDPMLKKHTSKIYYGSRFYVDTDFFRIIRNVPERKETIGYLGRFEEVKGVVNFAKAILLVCKKSAGVEFVIGGDGVQRDEIVKEIKAAGLSDRVKLTGWVPHENLPAFLNNLKLVVVPSFAEVGPHIVFEAIACGTPVLATPVGVIPDVIKDGETGFIMVDNSPECIARNIIRALNSPELDRITRAARSLVEKEYTHAAAVNRYRNILASLK